MRRTQTRSSALLDAMKSLMQQATRGLLHKALHGIEQGAAAGLGAAHEHTPEANANGSGLPRGPKKQAGTTIGKA